MEDEKEELTEQEQTILSNHGKDFLERWKRDQEAQEWYGKKIYIFQYYEIYDEDEDELRYFKISLIDKNEKDATRRAIEGFEKKYWKMEDHFEDSFTLEFVIENDYVKYLLPEYFGITEWV